MIAYLIGVCSTSCLFTNDSKLFIKPVERELTVTHELLDLFGQATGLVANLHESAFAPIRCDGIEQ